jgi:hypothetical protein
LNAGHREFPQVAAVVSINRSQCIQTFDKHAPFEEQGRMAAAVPLRHFEVDVTEPQGS